MQFLTLRTGDTIRIDGYRGDGETRYSRVLHIRDTHKEYLRLSSRYRKPPTTTSRYLITVMDLSRKEVRSYYTSHCQGLTVLGFWGRLWLKLRGV